ncbi:RTA1 like protein-domain-containing protein [Lipomyces tetrasporus]
MDGIGLYSGFILFVEISCTSSTAYDNPYLIAPALFAASIYMELGRIILLVDGESRSLIKKKWQSKIFVAGDVLPFLMQAGGGGIMASGSQASQTTGERIIIGGLGIQLLFFGFFVVTAAVFQGRLHRHPTLRSSVSLPWRKHQYTLQPVFLFSCGLFRLIEYCQGNDGFILRHEYFLYVFDATLMCGVMVLFLVVYPCELTRLLVEMAWEKEPRTRGVGYEMIQPVRVVDPPLTDEIITIGVCSSHCFVSASRIILVSVE